MKRSIGITIFGWSMIVLSFFSSFSFFKTFPLQKGAFLYLSIIYFLSLLFIGIGILKLERWARILLFWLVAIKIVDISFKAVPYLLKPHTKIIGFVDIIGILVTGAFVFWFFNRKSIKEQFISK